MKTISEMQMLIKDAYSNLDELSRSLSEYSISKDTEVTIDFEKLKIIGSRNPINGHILAKADELTKKYYLTLLISLVYLANENQENAWLLVQRITYGAGVKVELTDLAVDALNMTDKQIDDFTCGINNFDLGQAFVLDCILVYLSCEKSNENMLKYIAILSKLTKCNKKEVQELSELARSIAEENYEKYAELCIANEPCIKIKDFNFYIDFKKPGIIINNSKIMYVYGNAGSFSNIIKDTDTKKEVIIFEQMTISNELVEVIGFKKVVFNNCTFKNINNIDDYDKYDDEGRYDYDYDNSYIAAISFCNNSEVEFHNCVFEDISNRKKYRDNLIRFKNNTTIKLDSCFFKDIYYNFNDDYFSSYYSHGVIAFDDNKTIAINNCEFIDISSYCQQILCFSNNQIIKINNSIYKDLSSDGSSTGLEVPLFFVDNHISEMQNCVLENVKGEFYAIEERPRKGIKTLKTNNCTAKNCRKINICDKINPIGFKII